MKKQKKTIFNYNQKKTNVFWVKSLERNAVTTGVVLCYILGDNNKLSLHIKCEDKWNTVDPTTSQTISCNSLEELVDLLMIQKGFEGI